MHLLPAAGPRNPPLPWPARLVVVAWLELLAALAASAWLALMVWLFASPAYECYVCEGKGRRCRVDLAGRLTLLVGVEAFFWYA